MNDQENNKFLITELNVLLGTDNWDLYQFQIEENEPHEKKLLFNSIPGPLIADFFQNNLINKLNNYKKSRGWIELWATGLDDIMWKYHLIKSSNKLKS